MYSRQPHDLADEPLDAVERCLPGPPGGLGPLDALGGVEQAEVEGGGEEAVAHHRVGGEHGVLVRAEGGEAVGDEAAQGVQGLAAGGGEVAGAVAADEGDLAGAFPAVEVVADLLVDGVLAGAVGGGDVQGPGVAGRGFAVVVVEVPAARGGAVALHEEVVGGAGAAVEVLLAQRAPAPALRPVGELLVADEEAPRGQDGDLGEGVDQGEGGAGGGVVDGDGPLPGRLPQALPVRPGLHVRDAVAQLGGAVAHRGEDEVGLGTVEAAAPEHRAGLDHHQRGVPVRPVLARGEEVRAELVAEEPVDGPRPLAAGSLPHRARPFVWPGGVRTTPRPQLQALGARWMRGGSRTGEGYGPGLTP